MHESPTPGGGGRYRADAARLFPPHQHANWEFVYYTSGTTRVTQLGGVISATAGTLTMTPPGVIHSEFGTTAYSNIYLEVVADPSADWPQWIGDDERGSLARVISSIVDEPVTETRMRTLLMQQLLLHIERARCAGEISSRARLAAAVEFRLRECIVDKISLASLARELSVAPSTLRSAVAAERGISPRELYSQLRIQHTVALLRRSTLTLEHLALLSGYSSASHLSRSIKAATGMSPKDIRRTAG